MSSLPEYLWDFRLERLCCFLVSIKCPVDITPGNIYPIKMDMLVKIALYPVGKKVSHFVYSMETLQEAHRSNFSQAQLAWPQTLNKP